MFFISNVFENVKHVGVIFNMFISNVYVTSQDKLKVYYSEGSKYCLKT